MARFSRIVIWTRSVEALSEAVVPRHSPLAEPPEIPTPTIANGQLEIIFCPDAKVYDGRFANNGWLQELPDPMTRLTWDNAAMMSPATAEKLGVRSQDVVRLKYQGREIEAPVYVMPGQADGTVALPLGYGRTAAGKVGGSTADGVAAGGFQRLSAADQQGHGLRHGPDGRADRTRPMSWPPCRTISPSTRWACGKGSSACRSWCESPGRADRLTASLPGRRVEKRSPHPRPLSREGEGRDALTPGPSPKGRGETERSGRSRRGPARAGA